ncbi:MULTISPECIES: hypothetical protein [unclassified Leucobacter]|uniref:hypothetical protein n=1 Tax=unclassified Leucobacter TaxID=2621730 RepID=UPI0013047136|nr:MULTISPECIES: hypothetical protein [unclassified Leucobacter]
MNPSARSSESSTTDRSAKRDERVATAAARRERRYSRLVMQPNEMLVRRRGCGCCD